MHPAAQHRVLWVQCGSWLPVYPEKQRYVIVWYLISPIFCGDCGIRAVVWAISGLSHWELKGELKECGGGDVILSVNMGLKS